jgi:hypothetical protein
MAEDGQVVVGQSVELGADTGQVVAEGCQQSPGLGPVVHDGLRAGSVGSGP